MFLKESRTANANTSSDFFEKPNELEEHRHVIWFGGNANLMFTKMEDKDSKVSSCLGKQECRYRLNSEIWNSFHMDYETTTL